jgi:hypothetical protein
MLHQVFKKEAKSRAAISACLEPTPKLTLLPLPVFTASALLLAWQIKRASVNNRKHSQFNASLAQW